MIIFHHLDYDQINQDKEIQKSTQKKYSFEISIIESFKPRKENMREIKTISHVITAASV